MLTKSKSFLLGSSLLAGLTLLSGCGAKSLPPRVHNTNISQYSLYIPYDEKEQNFKNEIYSSGVGSGFDLKDYSPYGFYSGPAYSKLSGVLWYTQQPTPNNPYEDYECRDTGFTVFTRNLIMSPFMVGINLIAGGGWCEHIRVFDYEAFDEDAKEFVKDNNIKRKELLSSYSDLMSVSDGAKSKIAKNVSNINYRLQTQYRTYMEKESNIKTPKIATHYDGKNGFYKGEDLKEKVVFVKNKLDRKTFSYDVYYSSFINDAFPCKPNQECLNNFDRSKKNIVAQNDKDLKGLALKAKKSLQTTKAILEKEIATLNVKYPHTEVIESFGNKTLHYFIKTKDVVPSNTKVLPVTYKIVSADFTDVFPYYTNQNRDITIVFNPKDQTIHLSNKTNKFIEIDSISLYYNNDVYKINQNQTKNYSREISPQAISTFKLIRTIPNAQYKGITYAQAKNKTVQFGFALKYSIGDSTKEHTLYKLKKVNLVKLLLAQ
jgi:hypothetical protein